MFFIKFEGGEILRQTLMERFNSILHSIRKFLIEFT